jgi:hypothetical protein
VWRAVQNVIASEAKQSILWLRKNAKMDCFVAMLLAMTLKIQTRPRDLAAPFRASFARKHRVLITEGAGNAGRTMRPQPRVQMKKAHEQVTTVTPVSPDIPRAMVLTAYSVLSPVTGLFCHRRLRSYLRRLDASVGASGPHDFAVRSTRIRQRRRRVHRIPPPTSVTIAKRPSEEAGRVCYIADFTRPSSGIAENPK